MKTHKTVAKKTSDKPLHVLETMFIQGEFYTVSKSNNSDYVKVSGKFQNSLGGTARKEQELPKAECQEHLIYVEGNEKELYPKYVYCSEKDENGEYKKLYDLYEAYKSKKVGTLCTSEAGAPGIGKCITVITKITKKGIYGVEIFNNIFVPDISYYM
jgi:hypothetical protein